MSAKVIKKESAVSAEPFSISGINGIQNFQTAQSYSPIEEIGVASGNAPLSNLEGEPYLDFSADDGIDTSQAGADRQTREAIEKEAEERTTEMREKFRKTLEELDGLRNEIYGRAEREIVELALEIAKKIVSREVMFDREIALTLVKVSLKKINSRAPLAKIHLHPEDLAYIESRRDQLDFRGTLELITDRSISPGGCLVHTENGEVDARIESQFEEISHALLGN